MPKPAPLLRNAGPVQRNQEQRDRNDRYYRGLAPHRNFREFGKPEFIDAAGRYYRVSGDTLSAASTGGGNRRFDVKLPHGVAWFGALPHRTHLVNTTTGATVDVVVRKAFILQPGHRTGHVDMTMA